MSFTDDKDNEGPEELALVVGPMTLLVNVIVKSKIVLLSATVIRVADLVVCEDEVFNILPILLTCSIVLVKYRDDLVLLIYSSDLNVTFPESPVL